MHKNSLLLLLVSTLPVDAYLTTTARLPEAVVHGFLNVDQDLLLGRPASAASDHQALLGLQTDALHHLQPLPNPRYAQRLYNPGKR